MHAESDFKPGGGFAQRRNRPDAADAGNGPRSGRRSENPRQNADAGAPYLRDLLARYEDKPDQVLLALAAYNAGPAAVEKYHGVPPYRETREYILRVLKNWNPLGNKNSEIPNIPLFIHPGEMDLAVCHVLAGFGGIAHPSCYGRMEFAQYGHGHIPVEIPAGISPEISPDTREELDLVARANAGDGAAFSILISRYEGKIFAWR